MSTENNAAVKDVGAPAAKPGFSVQGFAPVWGATVMGTGVIAVIFAALARVEIFVEASVLLSRVFAFIALAVGIVVLGITAVRWIRYPKNVMADLNHPVKGAMSATFAGGFLVLGVVSSRVGESLVGATNATWVTIGFTVVGAVLALYIGFVFLGGVLSRGDVPPPMITGAWFIPPVVTIIVPTALAPLLKDSTALAVEGLWIAWAFLGMGSMLYLVVVAALFYRTATNPLPPAQLAPSLLIGMGPAGLIGLNLQLMAEASGRLGFGSEAMTQMATAAGVIIWGFGLWWAIATLVVLKKGYKKLPFSLAWWGFTFPLGAWVVAGLILGQTSGSLTVTWLSVVGAVFLFVLWVCIVLRTLKGIRAGTVWEA